MPNKAIYYFKEVLNEIGIKTDFIDSILAAQTKKNMACREMLERHFKQVESVILKNRWHYDSANELLDRMKELYPDQIKLFDEKSEKIKAYFSDRISSEGEIVIEIGSQFWHCRL